MKVYERLRFSPKSVAIEELSTDQYPVVRAIAVLQRQCSDTVELQDKVDHARETMNSGVCAPNIRFLLNGLAGELSTGSDWLRERIASLSPGLLSPQMSGIHSQSVMRHFRAEGFNCHTHLENLLHEYAHYARATCDSIAFLDLLGDTDSVRMLQKLSRIADRGIWFIELYMEGLALHMDVGRLPKFNPGIGI